MGREKGYVLTDVRSLRYLGPRPALGLECLFREGARAALGKPGHGQLVRICEWVLFVYIPKSAACDLPRVGVHDLLPVASRVIGMPLLQTFGGFFDSLFTGLAACPVDREVNVDEILRGVFV